MEELSACEPGTRVRIRSDPGRVGVLSGKSRERAGRVKYQVVFPDEYSWVLESNLIPVKDVSDHPVDLLRQGDFGRAADLRANLTHIRLDGRLADLIYSMETTNTDFYAYQFKPVLNFLDSPSGGLLIADEVGLGKTIEAGLIWTELRSRFDARRVAVVCPAMLREKWRDELRLRFGVDAQICNAREALRQFEEYAAGERQDIAIVGSLQGWRPRRGWDKEDAPEYSGSKLSKMLWDHAYDNPLLDLLIIDEAHYLRNPESMTAHLGQLMRRVADHVALLSATPLHLKSADLFHLLNLIDADTFSRVDQFDNVLQANEPILKAREVVLRGGADPDEILELLKEARAHPLLANSRQLGGICDELSEAPDLANKEFRADLAGRLERMNLLGRAVSRTRKMEVLEWRVQRKAYAESLPLAPEEREFYTQITDLVRKYCEERAAHEGFLLVTPQRQMSSSMPAALAAWKDKADEWAASASEDFGGLEEEVAKPGPLVARLMQDASKFGDYETLYRADSKYRRLVQQLSTYFAQNPGEKVVLFAYFRPTLKYLSKRLLADGIDNIVLMGGSGNKYEIMQQFEQVKGNCVLLASEVATEGVDLQFCRVLVNYDLPWNPMKVEQRIGRIDRLGQQSPTISIWNLFYRDTIDERIYSRLYNRLKIFEQALGGLDAVLGDEIHSMTMELLSAQMTPEQEQQRINQTAQALANRLQQEQKLESEAVNLIAHGDYILNQVRAAKDLTRHISAHDLLIYVRDFLKRDYQGSEFAQLREDKPVYDVSVAPEGRTALGRFIQENRLHGKTQLASSHKPIECEFSSKVSVRKHPRKEIINQFHPLIRFVSKEIRARDQSFYPTVSVSITHSDIPEISSGVYVFAVDKWSVGGLRDIEKLHFSALRVGDIEGCLSAQDAERLVTRSAQSGVDWHAADEAVDLHDAADSAEKLLENAERAYQAFVEQTENENNDRADIQQQSARSHLEAQEATLTRVAADHRNKGRDSLAVATEGKLEKLRNRVNERLTAIEGSRHVTHHRKEACLGLIRVTGPGSTEEIPDA
jgi:superfamily II DNA or RNA helicase